MNDETSASAVESPAAAALREWARDGPPVAVLEGFHGVGKTDLVTKLVQTSLSPAAYVQVTSSGDLGLQDLLLDLAGELELSGNSLMADALDDDLLSGLEAALRQSCIVVIDDFTELLSPGSGLPPQDFVIFLTKLTKRPSTRGRLLLVTDKRLSLAEDMELTIIRLGPPAEVDAVRLLGKMLEMRGRESEIPENRRRDVVRWLGCNPRALQALVACLEADSLDDLISTEGENWDLKDELFSPTLVQELERRFRARTLSRLSPAGLVLLQFLSVYRRPFVKEGVSCFATRIGDITNPRRELAEQFLLDHIGRWFFLNPISRELAIARLRHDPKNVLDAHSLAANHYTRHFRAKGEVDLAANAAEFVEARYHLANSARTEEFADIASRYRRYLLGNVRRLKSIPGGAAERNQLIATLSAALSEDQLGYSQPRFLLARLLEQSPNKGDKVRALRQATLACRDSLFAGVWVLRVRLSAQLETPATTLAILGQAKAILPIRTMTDVYYAATKMLADEAVQASELVTLLNAATNGHETDPEAWMIFQLGATILARLRRYDDAIKLLRDYLFTGVPVEFLNRTRMVEQMLLLAYGTQDRQKLINLRPLLDNELAPQRVLFNCLCALLDDDFETASEAVATGAGFTAAATMQAAFAELCRGYPDRAREFISRRSENYSQSHYWLTSLVALSLGELEVARTGLQTYLDRELGDDEPLSFSTWVKAWDDTAGSLGQNAAFYFPKLPSQLTGLDYDVFRFQGIDDIIDKAFLARLPDRPRNLAADIQEAGAKDSEDLPAEPPGEAVATAAPTLINVVHVSQEGSHMGDKNIVGQAAAVGSRASASNVTLQQLTGVTNMELPALAQELDRLRVALREQPTSDENDEALAEISRAARAANDGDEAKVVSHLRASGQWALRTANAIGVALAAEAIKRALGG